MRLTRLLHEAHGATISDEYCIIGARALDDAGGVREAVEKLEWILMGKTPPWIVEAATEALAALTGTKEVSDE